MSKKKTAQPFEAAVELAEEKDERDDNQVIADCLDDIESASLISLQQEAVDKIRAIVSPEEQTEPEPAPTEEEEPTQPA